METRGIRNCNPGNIRRGSKWVGLRPEQTDKAFDQFIDMKWGVRAIIIVLRSYVTIHHCQNVKDIIRRWAPPSDGNDTEDYIKRVQTMLNDEGFTISETLGGTFFQANSNEEFFYIFVLIKAICFIESGYRLPFKVYLEAYYLTLK